MVNNNEFDKKKRIFAFVDILGFSHMIKTPGCKPADVLDLFSTYVRSTAAKFKQVEFLYFSDSVVICADFENITDFVEALICLYQNCFTSPHILLRGGVAVGEVRIQGINYIAKNQNCWGKIILGEPVVESVQLEKKLKGARICLSSEAAEEILSQSGKVYLCKNKLSELQWVPQEYENDYVEELCYQMDYYFIHQPSAVIHYSETVRMIINHTKNENVVNTVFNWFAKQSKKYLLPPEAIPVLVDCVEKFIKLESYLFVGRYKTGAYNFTENQKALNQILDSSNGRDLEKYLRDKPDKIRSAILSCQNIDK